MPLGVGISPRWVSLHPQPPPGSPRSAGFALRGVEERRILLHQPLLRARLRVRVRQGLFTAAIGIQQPVIVPLKFRLEVFIANPRFEDFDVSAGVCGSSSLRGTG